MTEKGITRSSCLVLMFVVLASCRNSRDGEAPLLVVPGKSIAGIELGMSREQVVAILGKPAQELDARGQVGWTARALGGGKIEELPPMTVLRYTDPALLVVLHEDGKVGAIELGYTERVEVKGFEFLKFRYLTRDELERLGKPLSAIRDLESERVLGQGASEEIEYYVYEYPRMTLGLVFERERERSSRHFIGLNYIGIHVKKILKEEKQQ